MCACVCVHVCVCVCVCVCVDVCIILETLLLTDLFHLILTARCDPLSRPINGYILINTSTSVTFVCQNQTQPHIEISFTATCNILNGVWEPNPRDHCTSSESNGKNTCLLLTKLKINKYNPTHLLGIQYLFQIIMNAIT